MEDEKVLPCPFCSSTDIRFTRHKGVHSPTGVVWSTCCYNCGATFPNTYQKQTLVKSWNKREKSASTIPGVCSLCGLDKGKKNDNRINNK